VTLGVVEKNNAAVSVYKKTVLKWKGFATKPVLSDGEYCDTLYME